MIDKVYQIIKWMPVGMWLSAGCCSVYYGELAHAGYAWGIGGLWLMIFKMDEWRDLR